MIRNCLPILQKIYNITKRLQTPDEIEIYSLGFLAFIDCTEQQIPRSTDNKRKKKIFFYSEKKRKHAINTKLMVNNRGYNIHKTIYKKESRHDY